MASIKWDHAAFNAEVLSAPFMQQHMHSIVETAQVIAESLAPVGDPKTDRHAGRYKDSFGIESGIRDSNGPRAIGTLFNTSPEAVFVEHGTHQQEAQHVLLKAMNGAVQ